MNNLTFESLNEKYNLFVSDPENVGSDMWKDRLISYLAAIKNLSSFLDGKKVVEYLELSRLIRAAYGEDYENSFKKYGEEYNSAVSPLRSYLKSLTGFDESKIYDQPEKTIEQHGYVMMQLQRIN